MANKTITFGTNLNPNGDLTYSLGNSDNRWIVYGNTTELKINKQTAKKLYILGTQTAVDTQPVAAVVESDTGIYATTTGGQLNATTFKVNEKVTLQWNSTDSSLDFVFA